MPEKAKTLNKTVWFCNPWFDIVFLASFPTFLIIILLLNYPFFRLPYYLFDFYVIFYLYTLFNFPHILSGVSIVYLDQRERKGQSLKFLWIPLFFLLAMIAIAILGVRFNFSGKLSMIRHWGGSLHNILQSYYILLLYKLRNNDSLKFDMRIDSLFLIVCYLDSPLLSLLFQMERRYNIDEIFFRAFIIFWRTLLYVIVIAFVLRQVYLFIRYKKIHPFKILLFSAIFIVYQYLFIVTKSLGIAWKGLVELHNLQWIAWVWFYHRQKFREGMIKEARFISYLSQPGKTRLYIFLLMLISAMFNFFVLTLSRLAKIPFNIAGNIIQSPLALFHFFIEIFIWRYSSLRKVILEAR